MIHLNSSSFVKRPGSASHTPVRRVNSRSPSTLGHLEENNVLDRNDFIGKSDRSQPGSSKQTPRAITSKIRVDKKPVQRLWLRKEDDEERLKRKKKSGLNVYQPLGAIIFGSLSENSTSQENREESYEKYREQYDKKNFMTMESLKQKLSSSENKTRNKTCEPSLNLGLSFDNVVAKQKELMNEHDDLEVYTIEEAPPNNSISRPYTPKYMLNSPKVTNTFRNYSAKTVSKTHDGTSDQRRKRDDSDVFMKEIQHIEKLNRERITTAKDSQRVSSNVVNDVRSREKARETLAINDALSRTQHDNVEENINGGSHKETISVESLKHSREEGEEMNEANGEISVCQEPLKLQYDPSQITHNSAVSLSANKQTAVKDFLLMAQACNRAGRNRMEGLAYYKIGCKYEEEGVLTKALKHYKKFLHISQSLQDDTAVCLGLNCIGVLYQKEAMSVEDEETRRTTFETSLDYHARHWEMADSQGRVVSHINMGLVYYLMRDRFNAMENFKSAYKCAVDIGDKHGESIALANLGILGKEQGDLENAWVLIERHLELSESLHDSKSSSDAYKQLGYLSEQKGDVQSAMQYLNRARDMAIAIEDQTKADELKCTIGVVGGNAAFEQLMTQIAQDFISSNTDNAPSISPPPP